MQTSTNPKENTHDITLQRVHCRFKQPLKKEETEIEGEIHEIYGRHEKNTKIVMKDRMMN